MAKFIDADYIIGIVGAANPALGLTSTHLSDDLLINASQEVIERTGYDWVKLRKHTFTLDGNGKTWIIVPEKPIISLSQIKIYNSDRSQYEDISTTSDFTAKIVIDYDNGIIQTIAASSWTVAAAVFLEGFQNVEIIGDYGVDGTVHPMIKQITMLVALRNLQLFNPSKFKFDIIMEKLGKYQYQTSTSGVAKENEKLSLDGQINMLIDQIQNVNSFYIGEA